MSSSAESIQLFCYTRHPCPFWKSLCSEHQQTLMYRLISLVWLGHSGPTVSYHGLARLNTFGYAFGRPSWSALQSQEYSTIQLGALFASWRTFESVESSGGSWPQTAQCYSNKSL